MPIIIEYSKQGAFDPETIEAMTKAYDLSCLAMPGHPESTKERLARLIIEVAKDGERDPVKLSNKALHALRS